MAVERDVVPVDQLVEVTTYAEVQEAFRASVKLAVEVDRASAPLRAGTVLRIDGEAHSKRRRLLNRLVFRGEHQRFRADVFAPAFDRHLETARADGAADLVSLCTRALTELVAAMIGLPLSDANAAEELFHLQAQLDELPRLLTQLKGAAPVPADEHVAASIERALRGKREFVDRHWGPALAERSELVARVERGELPESAIPNDMLSIVVAHAEPRFDEDPDLPVREAIIDLLHAGTGTSVGAVVHTVDELSRYLVTHPSDTALLAEPRYILACVHEVLRLHTSNPGDIRRATEDVALCGGTRIAAGQVAALRTGVANRDAAVFGPDADRFDPHRSVPAGVHPYGLAFGSGPHMCFGLPLALGDEGTDGNLVLMVRALVAAGARPDPLRPPRRRPSTHFADLRAFETYPIDLSA